MSALRRTGKTIRYTYRAWRRPNSVLYKGVRLPTEDHLVPEDVIEQIFRERFARTVGRFCRDELKRGDRVLDLGGGVGFLSSLAAKICGDSNVVTYEANPEMEQTIRHTHALNGVSPRVVICAVAPETGPATFYKNDDAVSSSLIDRNFGGKTTVDGRALADILVEEKPTAIVSDIEGAEVSVFEGVDLSGVDKILIKLHPRTAGAVANAGFLRTLEDQGFTLTRGTRKRVAFLQRL